MGSWIRSSTLTQTLRKFAKYHGAGNDFILFEDFKEDFPLSKVPFLCDRHLGIGADGLILARHSLVGDFRMVFFNRDGSRGSMCGNGLRCFVHFLRDQGKKIPSYAIEIGERVLTVKVDGQKISTFLGPAKVLKWNEAKRLYVIDTGAIHAVSFAQNKVDVQREGRFICQDKTLHPQGVNANFVWLKKENALEVRTYEKGVDAETLACGTGAAAAAFVASKLGITKEKVTVHTRSKEVLEIHLKEEIEVIGPSTKVFDGQIKI